MVFESGLPRPLSTSLQFYSLGGFFSNPVGSRTGSQSFFSMAFGHRFPRVIIAGTFPCPTTALALVLLTTALPRVDKIIYIILLFWAIPFPPFIQIPKYGVYEDTIMFAIGIYSLVMLLKNWKEKSAPNQGIQPTAESGG